MNWQPIETAPKGKKLIVGYRNECGKWRTVMARYYLPNTLEMSEDTPGYYDLDENEQFAPEGWYEETDAYEYTLPTAEPPTNWQPLPEPPND